MALEPTIMHVDIQSITEKYSNVMGVNEVVGVWEVWVKECPIDLNIKVVRTSSLDFEFPYMGIANYPIQSPEEEDSYMSIHSCRTIQEAFEDALKGILAYYKSELTDETKFVLDKNW